MFSNGSNLKPFSFDIKIPPGVIDKPDNHILRKLSSMNGQYYDKEAYDLMLQREDTLVYEVYEKLVPEIPGELIQGLSIVHPGKVGNEYFMTKGHFHSVIDTGELYYCLQGHGHMMMETHEGDWALEEMVSNRAVYVPGRWAHRSINIGNVDLIMLFVYPANAGHDYGTIESKSFRKMVINQDGRAVILDNPKWRRNETTK
jgi:glucose-6-phosphate isomerase